MISRQHRFSPCIIASVLLGVWTAVTRGEISVQLIPQNPVIGGSVTLTVTGITGKLQYLLWFKGQNSNPENRILSYFPGDKEPNLGPLFHDRIKPLSAGNLEISNLNRTDEGNYIAKIQSDSASIDKSVNLKIYDSDMVADSSGNLGTIIGCVVAALLLMVLVAALVYLFVIHRRHKKQKADSLRKSTKGGNSRNGQANARAPVEHPPEIQYADIVIKNMPRKEQPPPETVYANRVPPAHPPQEAVVYSELRIN